MSPEEHLAHIKQTIDYALSRDFTVNLYLEDWSSGMRDSRDYLFTMMDELVKLPIKRFLLPDTLGILNPLQCVEYMRQMVRRYPNSHFDFHAHNDYDLAVSNSLAAVLSGAKGLHVTVNGLGERCGNAPLASVQVILKDMFEAKTNIKEDRLNDISRLVEGYSGIAVAPNTPVVGDNVFTQWLAYMLMATTRTSFIATTRCLSVSADIASMHWARIPVRQTSSRTSMSWDWS